jgi:hypothetical protein
MPEITLLVSTGGPLTKRIALNAAGEAVSSSDRCCLSSGYAYRVSVADADALARVFAGMTSEEALAMGELRDGLPDAVYVTTKSRLMNGTAATNIIARTATDIIYRNAPGFSFIDFDSKGMPGEVRNRLDQIGGVEAALYSILPELATTAQLKRASTSAGLYRTDTGQQFPGSGGIHLYLAVTNPLTIRASCERCTSAAGSQGMAGTCLARRGHSWSARSSTGSSAAPSTYVLKGRQRQ